MFLTVLSSSSFTFLLSFPARATKKPSLSFSLYLVEEPSTDLPPLETKRFRNQARDLRFLMGCFLACFGTSKNWKRHKLASRVLPGDQRHGCSEPLQPTFSSKQYVTVKPISPVSELRDKAEKQLSFIPRKRVTFDLNVKTYEGVSTHEPTNYSAESDEEKERGKGEETGENKQSFSLSEDDSITSSTVSFPPNHRYGNCRNSDDEDDGIESDISDLEDEDYNDDDDEEEEEEEEEDVRRVPEEESSKSFFSLPMESGRSTFSTPLFEKTIRSNQNARDRSQYVHSVLNPVENLTQWKSVKTRTTPPSKHQTKENINFDSEPQIPFSSEPTFKQSPNKRSFSFNHPKPPKKETAVDASLSNWLGSSETTTPITKTSTVNVPH
ncbi:PREDICTED: histone H3.v1 [Nelumbo nucifera]|uniref:Histone H3.v1-like n=2 Tax=Nelumbo nucifera TaxID=4432 RepID=A0A822YZG5_NELNU|nr:PREDICTED: histone H3.v1 [Nelumbo nucifera]DAD36851.1 TPA_asm: hypothetical protein HUJ06_007492 [Nelumbo nucifera]